MAAPGPRRRSSVRLKAVVSMWTDLPAVRGLIDEACSDRGLVGRGRAFLRGGGEADGRAGFESAAHLPTGSPEGSPLVRGGEELSSSPHERRIDVQQGRCSHDTGRNGVREHAGTPCIMVSLGGNRAAACGIIDRPQDLILSKSPGRPAAKTHLQQAEVRVAQRRSRMKAPVL
mgnify:CR=1 FL=1